MKVQLLDRVTTNRIEKYQLIFRAFAIICALVALIVTACIIFIPFVKTTQFWFDYTIALMLPLLYTAAIRIIAKNRKGQFIEWWTDRVVFKTKHDTAENTILLSEIDTINIERTAIDIATLDKGDWIIHLDDFSDYDMREHIKEGFDKLNFDRRRDQRSALYIVPVPKSRF